jgi:tRNA (guanine26-N2/guanine27-N2)-dimethyltransferase
MQNIRLRLNTSLKDLLSIKKYSITFNYRNMSTTSETTHIPIIPQDRELIEEGSAKMLYPKGVVFYNPVQVQNRDLSLVMMQLYAERKVQREHLKVKKKQLLKLAREDIGKDTENMDEQNHNTHLKHKKKQPKPDMNLIEQQLEEYKQSTDWSQIYASNTSKGIRILDALAASGLRSIRYYNEISSSLLHSVTINDLDIAATDLAKENIAFNGISEAMTNSDDEPKKGGICIQNYDATHLMYLSRRSPNLQSYTPSQSIQKDQYDVIDLDPYGSAAPFLDSALQAITNGGLIACTCTDMAALGGSHPDTCYGRYGSMSIPRVPYLQESALRILLHTIAQRAAVYGKSIRPILSVGMHFYVRVFFEVWEDKQAVNNLSLSIGTVYQSAQCSSFHCIPHGQHAKNNSNVIQATRAPLFSCCTETGGQFKTVGPLWLGPLHDKAVVNEAIKRLEALQELHNTSEETEGATFDKNITFGHLKMYKELHGLLTSCEEELDDVPLYYTMSNLAHTLSCQTPPINIFKSALINAGYRVSGYHKDAEAVKTDAPSSVVWDVMRAWCKDHPPNLNSKKNKNKAKKRQKVQNSSKIDKKDTDNGTDDQVLETKEFKSVAEKILCVEPNIQVNFNIVDELKNRKKACRFPMNPEANWGPKKAASGYKRKGDE